MFIIQIDNICLLGGPYRNFKRGYPQIH